MRGLMMLFAAMTAVLGLAPGAWAADDTVTALAVDAACVEPTCNSAAGLAHGGAATSRVRTQPGEVATRSSTGDTAALTVTFTRRPPPVTNDVHPVIEFTTSEPAVTFACVHVLPDGTRVEWPCGDPLRDLVDGPHAFEVRARDAAGNEGRAVATFTVDTVAPEPVRATQVAPAAFAFGAPEPGLRFECRLHGAAVDTGLVGCASPQQYAGLGPGDYVFTLVAIDAAGNAAAGVPHAFTIAPAETPRVFEAPPAPVVPPAIAPAPTPRAGQTVLARATLGRIVVRRPGAARFVPLERATAIPVGSEIDAKRGRVLLTIQPAPGRALQRATVHGGIFIVKQSSATVDLTLSEQLAPCATRRGAPGKRRLVGEGRGRFRTNGRFSSAIVRGGKWLVEDSCAGTLTRATRGVLSVRDNRRRKTVLVRAGTSYLAKPPR